MGRKKRSSKKGVKISFIICLILFSSVACGYTTYHYNELKYWNNYMYPGVMIQGIDVSEKTKEQAFGIINQMYLNQVPKNSLNVKVENKNYTLEYSKLNPKYDVNKAVNEAFSYGKNSNIFNKYKLIKSNSKHNFKLEFSFDQKPVKEFIDNIEKETNKNPVNATLNLSANEFKVIPEQNGKKLIKDKLEKEVLSKLNNDLDKSTEFNAEVKTTAAKINANALKPIDAMISSYSTNFGGISSGARSNNIRLATKSINGTVVMPGESFSFNNVVGERTSDRGYMAAPVIIANKLESGLGGGVCQVSSTLFNAVNNAGISATERSHHTMPVHYVPKGMDATVDYGNIDYKFKNIYEYPLYIEAFTSGGTVTFNLYSSSKINTR